MKGNFRIKKTFKKKNQYGNSFWIKQVFKMQPICTCPSGEKCFCSNSQTVKTRELQKSCVHVHLLFWNFCIFWQMNSVAMLPVPRMPNLARESSSAGFKDTIWRNHHKQHSRCVEQFFLKSLFISLSVCVPGRSGKKGQENPEFACLISIIWQLLFNYILFHKQARKQPSLRCP